MSGGKERSGQITVAVIGCLGAIIAATITGIFTLIGTSRSPIFEPATTAVVVAASKEDQPAPPTTGTTDELADAVSASNVGIDPSTLRQPLSLPTDVFCPTVPYAGWLQLPLIWYGPFLDRNSISHSIGFDNFQIHTWNSSYGIQSWSIPQHIQSRNQWIPLTGTPFSVCVDTAKNIFAVFNP